MLAIAGAVPYYFFPSFSLSFLVKPIICSLVKKAQPSKIVVMFGIIYEFVFGVLNLVVFSICGQAAADARYYGNTDVYNILKARGAKVPVHFVL